jgi:signal transduction histidine kinase
MRMKILIVDDNADDRRLLRYTFEHHNCTVTEAGDGQEALEKATDGHRPDIIVSDALMPRMDGFQFLRELKANPGLATIPFIFYSATYTGESEVNLALAIGAEAFFTKPQEPEQLWQQTEAIYRQCLERQPAAETTSVKEDEETFLKEYSVMVAAKLEKKVHELEQALALQQKAEDEIRILNAELEQRVQLRTAELVQKSKELEDHERALENLVEDLNVKAAELERANAVLSLEIRQREQAQEEIIWLNEDLRRQKYALEETNRELESFSYSVSHDLRAPLHHIDGFSRILQEEYADKLTDGGQKYLLRIRKNCLQMNALIDDLLRFSRLTRDEMHPTEVALSQMANEILDELHRAEPNRQVQVQIANEITCNGDAILLQAVMENLLGNAWKYTSKTSAAVIEFGVQVERDTPCYYVRDNGAGFDMAHADKLFGVFQRLHSQEEFEGTGVGLATVQRIIHRHGGQIWATGEVGRGCTFSFTLPHS